MSARELACVWMAAAGNRFAVLDGFAGPPPEDPAGLARELSRLAREAGAPWRPDGLLWLAPAAGAETADCSMVLHNLDGGRPEACGNGLRCVALLAARRGYAGTSVVVATDAGPRRVDVDLARSVARAEMGPVDVAPAPERVTAGGATVELTRASVGNPHAVVVVPDVGRAPVRELGPVLERHALFPGGVNVGFLALAARAGRAAVDLRVWERGVGETAACGTGATAAAFVAARRFGLAFPLSVRMPGGELVVDRAGDEARLAGPVEELGEGRLVLAGSSAAPYAGRG